MRSAALEVGLLGWRRGVKPVLMCAASAYIALATQTRLFDDVEQEYPRQHGRGLYSAKLSAFAFEACE